MPKFNVSLTVVRTIVQSKSVDLEIEAENAEAAQDKAEVMAEKSEYHDIEQKDWDLEEVTSEAQDAEVSGGDDEDE